MLTGKGVLVAFVSAVILLATVMSPGVAEDRSTAATDSGSDAPTTQQCLEEFKSRCYSPAQFNRAYGVTDLHQQNIKGQGQTVAIVMNRYKGLKQDLRYASKAWGLAKPKIKIAYPVGKAGTLGEPGEAALDVQTVHGVAPKAKILLLAVPVSSEDGIELDARPLAKSIKFAMKKRVTAISMSFGGVERTYRPLRRALKEARKQGIASFAGSGDWGTYLPAPDLPEKRTAFYPAADPNVTAVGGTSITLDSRGNRITDDVAWSTSGYSTSSGGGVAELAKRPKWQRVPGTSKRGRNYPDISLAADPFGSAFPVRMPVGGVRQWEPVGGTSHSTPLMAGITTLASQIADAPLPNVNRAIYKLSQRPDGGIDDIVWGWNYYVTPNSTIPGYVAVPGYDRVTGVGTFSSSRFIRNLARYAK
ncbi:MAG: S53 family peptidase [Actinomycetia bacterium]|nr:S53 family peptidase [Actinomycetes bacterium]